MIIRLCVLLLPFLLMTGCATPLVTSVLTASQGAMFSHGTTSPEYRKLMDSSPIIQPTDTKSTSKIYEDFVSTKQIGRDNAVAWKASHLAVSIGGGVEIDLQSIPGGLWFGKTEVTQRQWNVLMKQNPSRFVGPDHPVDSVTWEDCQKFLQKLNALPSVKASKMSFRLPTEMEWEYACRAGSTGDYCRLEDGTEISSSTVKTVAWIKQNSGGQTHPVGQKAPNAWGLYDMHGNLWEWTQTRGPDPDLRRMSASDAKRVRQMMGDNYVIRGGSWFTGTEECMADASSSLGSRGLGDSYYGFRVIAHDVR